ncbi:MAG: hypothetical protein GY801_30735 [bacterium]|nr:hypothetical protein [bacterium]
MKDDKTSLLQEVIERAFVGDAQGSIVWEKVLYALDKDLDYSKPIYKIKRSKLIQREKIESVLSEIFKDGPSWIHANVIFSSPEFVVLTLISGKAVGNPSPSINISYEKNRTIEVIEG